MAVFRLLILVGLCFLFGGSLARIYPQRNPFGRFFKRAAEKAADDKASGICKKPIDLLFVLDSSESVGALNWQKAINFTRKVASKFDVQYTRVGVIQYHSTAEVPIALTSFRDNKTLDDAISNIYFKPGATRTDLAILKAIDVFNQAPLRKASRLAIFVIGARSTDLFVSKGKSINATDLIKQPSADLQAGPVAVYAASVTEGLPEAEKLTAKDELNILTSNPPLDHIFESPTYDLLTAKYEDIAKKTCIVNGGMSPWSAWSTCSVTCGTGTRVRMRTCNNPKPENGGLSCTESTVESGECSVQSCPASKPGAGGSPWPPAPIHCTPNQASVYGYPDYKTCGNGFEMITLSHHQLTASSTYSKDRGDSLIKARHAPYNGIINNTQNAGGWCAEHQYAVNQDNNQYLTIDLGQAQLIGKVATQGMDQWDNWVSTFALKFSNDNIEWSTYQRTLQGNCDRKSISENILNPPVNARFVRFNPLTWYTAMEPAKHDICMRVAVYKCRDCKLVPYSRCQIYSRTETRSKKSTVSEREAKHLIKKVSKI